MKKLKPFPLTIIIAISIFLILLTIIWLFIPNYILNKNVVSPPPGTIDLSEPDTHDEIIEGKVFNTYVNHEYGFEFSYPKDFILDRGYMLDNNLFLGVHEKDYKVRMTISHYNSTFFNPPENEGVKNWVTKDAKDHIDITTIHWGQFNYALGQDFSIGGKETLHLYTHSNSGGYFDDFYLIHNGKMFNIQFEAPYDEDPKTGYLTFRDLDFNSNDWYVGVLKSFKFE